ncbi:MAG: hypothetical protein HOO86_01230 [Bacteroidales bacterium]|nr:hypothetical protein [Bacteroidales bacterium]
MKRLILFLTFTLLTYFVFSQKKETNDKKEIKQIVNSFMGCLIEKDSVKFYSLFHNEPVVWVGVFKEKSQQDRLKKDSTKKEYFGSTYQKFYRSISNIGANEEKFYNIDINEDGIIASVTFDYSFWDNKKKINWGKESWGLVKINGKWKITSVIFSLEFEMVNPEPKKKNKPN